MPSALAQQCNTNASPCKFFQTNLTGKQLKNAVLSTIIYNSI